MPRRSRSARSRGPNVSLSDMHPALWSSNSGAEAGRSAISLDFSRDFPLQIAGTSVICRSRNGTSPTTDYRSVGSDPGPRCLACTPATGAGTAAPAARPGGRSRSRAPAFERAPRALRTGSRLALGPAGRCPTARPRSSAYDADGACVFFDRDDGRLCAIHRELGADALPERVPAVPARRRSTTRAARRISLSHFCPTAAALLVRRRTRDFAIVAAPPLALGGDAEGLDARDALPPLLAPGMLMDLDGYDAWERARASRVLGRGDARRAPRALDRDRRRDARGCSDWRPERGPLRAARRPRVRRCVERRQDDEDLSADDRAGRPSPTRRCPSGIRRPPPDADIRRARGRGVAAWWPSVDRRSARTSRHDCSATGSPITATACTRSSSTCASACRSSSSRRLGTTSAPVGRLRISTMADRHRSHPKHRPAARPPVGPEGAGAAPVVNAARMTTTALERFLRYVTIDTRADERSTSCRARPASSRCCACSSTS